MQQPQSQTSSTPLQTAIPSPTGPVLLDGKLLALVSGAGPNGGWSALSGPNGGWY
jgi:hypothetical protein